jgi:hypothetical protein
MSQSIGPNPKTWPGQKPQLVALRECVQGQTDSIPCEAMRVSDYTGRIEKEIAGLQEDLTRLQAALVAVLPGQPPDIETAVPSPLRVADSAGPLIYQLAAIGERLDTTRTFVSRLTHNIQL